MPMCSAVWVEVIHPCGLRSWLWGLVGSVMVTDVSFRVGMYQSVAEDCHCDRPSVTALQLGRNTKSPLVPPPGRWDQGALCSLTLPHVLRMLRLNMRSRN